MLFTLPVLLLTDGSRVKNTLGWANEKETVSRDTREKKRKKKKENRWDGWFNFVAVSKIRGKWMPLYSTASCKVQVTKLDWRGRGSRGRRKTHHEPVKGLIEEIEIYSWGWVNIFPLALIHPFFSPTAAANTGEVVAFFFHKLTHTIIASERAREQSVGGCSSSACVCMQRRLYNEFVYILSVKVSH